MIISSITQPSIHESRPRSSTYMNGQPFSGMPRLYNKSRSNRINSLCIPPDDSDVNNERICSSSREEGASIVSNSQNGFIKSSSLTEQAFLVPDSSTSSANSMCNELAGGPVDPPSSPLVTRRCQSVLPSLDSNISSEENGRSPSPATSPILNPFRDSFEAANEESKQPLPHDHLRLGLNEDFFKPDQNETLGSTSVEELESAIATLRERIIHEPEESARREHLVRTLVNLRMRLQELKEERGSNGAAKRENSFSPESSTRLPTPVYMSSNESNPGDGGGGFSKAAPDARPNANAATAAKHAAHVRHVQGHSFLRATAALTDLKRSAPNLVGNALELGGLSPAALALKLRLTGHARSKNLYCDCCTRHIWDILQEWFVCVDCRYRVHSKCLNLVTRNCLAQWLKESPQYEMSICPEKGLLAQAFRCADCKASIFSKSCADDKSISRHSNPSHERDRTGDALSGLDCFSSSSSEHSSEDDLPAATSGSGRRSRPRPSTAAATGSAASAGGASAGNGAGDDESNAHRECERRSPDVYLSDMCNPLTLENASPARLCDYCGLYYCSHCHWNDQLLVPARLIRNWDFMPRPVCRRCRQKIRLLQNRAMLDFDALNPSIYDSVAQIAAIRRQRTRLLVMKKYFEVCPRALEKRLLLEVGHRLHFVENPSVYSLLDLIEIHTGALAKELDRILDIFATHIKVHCPLCQAKAFTCELCRCDELLWPFDEGAEDTVSQCVRCQTCFHRVCFERYAAQQVAGTRTAHSNGAIIRASSFYNTNTSSPSSPSYESHLSEPVRFDCPRCERLERRRLARKSALDSS